MFSPRKYSLLDNISPLAKNLLCFVKDDLLFPHPLKSNCLVSPIGGSTASGGQALYDAQSFVI